MPQTAGRLRGAWGRGPVRSCRCVGVVRVTPLVAPAVANPEFQWDNLIPLV